MKLLFQSNQFVYFKSDLKNVAQLHENLTLDLIAAEDVYVSLTTILHSWDGFIEAQGISN